MTRATIWYRQLSLGTLAAGYSSLNRRPLVCALIGGWWTAVVVVCSYFFRRRRNWKLFFDAVEIGNWHSLLLLK